MNTAGDARHGCYVAYLVPGKLLLLLPDSGDAGEATFREIGTPGTLETPTVLRSCESIFDDLWAG